MKRLIVIGLTLLAALPAHARMYQWVNAQTGRTQMSGKPPAWYRSDRPGPRVFVFDNGRLVDDTARPVSLEERAALRATAFTARDTDEPAAGLSSGEAAATGVDVPITGITEGTAAPQGSIGRGFGDEADAQQPAASAEPPDATIARLKSIIDAWEQQQTEEARRVLERAEIVAPAGGNAGGAQQAPDAAAPAPALPPAATPRP